MVSLWSINPERLPFGRERRTRNACCVNLSPPSDFGGPSPRSCLIQTKETRPPMSRRARKVWRRAGLARVGQCEVRPHSLPLRSRIASPRRRKRLDEKKAPPSLVERRAVARGWSLAAVVTHVNAHPFSRPFDAEPDGSPAVLYGVGDQFRDNQLSAFDQRLQAPAQQDQGSVVPGASGRRLKRWIHLDVLPMFARKGLHRSGFRHRHRHHRSVSSGSGSRRRPALGGDGTGRRPRRDEPRGVSIPAVYDGATPAGGPAVT